MRLLCDEMLTGFARWLRAAGYDTEVAVPGAADRHNLARSRAEDRVLITRDSGLARSGGGGARVLLLTSDDLDRQAREVAKGLALDWMRAPFSRCLMDNTPLQPVSEGEQARMPASARGLPGPFRACPRCGRIYWPGSHVRRMSERLNYWRSLSESET